MISENIVKAFNGQIGVDSQYGKGSQFVFSFLLKGKPGLDDLNERSSATASEMNNINDIELTEKSAAGESQDAVAKLVVDKEKIEKNLENMQTRAHISSNPSMSFASSKRSLKSSQNTKSVNSVYHTYKNIQPNRTSGFNFGSTVDLNIQNSGPGVINVKNMISIPEIMITGNNEIHKSTKKSRGKILIVDDEKSNCDIIYGLLMILGVTNRAEISKFAYNGEQAVQEIK